METKTHSLPPLPPRLQAATLASADNLTAIAHSEDVQLGGKNGEALPHLVTILYTIRERCVQAEIEPQPYLGDQLITPQEIAAVLESISHWMVGEEVYELVGLNPSWFTDAAAVVEQMVHDK
jgi:hypothetical protein